MTTIMMQTGSIPAEAFIYLNQKGFLQDGNNVSIIYHIPRRSYNKKILLVTLKRQKHYFVNFSSRLVSKKTDWSLYQNYLENGYKEFLNLDFNQSTMDVKYSFFVDRITEALLASSPVKRPFVFDKTRHKNPTPWWDDECDKFIRLRKAALKK